MKIKLNYFVIPLITIAVAALGSYFTQLGMPWYESSVIKPELTPPDIAFPIAWTTIYIATTISALIAWNKTKNGKHDGVIASIFLINAVLNAAWTLLFFTLHQMGLAFVEIIVLEATVLLLVLLTWEKSKIASLLLLPYLIWVGLASYLNLMLFLLN